ncbi:hypothetical protein RQP46_004038 [Phenoliferia psychrophenolica]
MTNASLCALCSTPLLIPSASPDAGPSHVPDDVHLACNCHFHWECLTDHYESHPTSSSSSRSCPSCGGNVLSQADGRFLVNVTNEGGFTGGYDFGEDLDEDERLSPEERRIELFLALVSQADHDEAEAFLRGEDEAGKGVPLDVNVVGEGDGGLTGLHIAAFNDDVEGVRMLLKYGARKDVRAKDGATPVDCARQVNAREVVDLLLSS